MYIEHISKSKKIILIKFEIWSLDYGYILIERSYNFFFLNFPTTFPLDLIIYILVPPLYIYSLTIYTVLIFLLINS